MTKCLHWFHFNSIQTVNERSRRPPCFVGGKKVLFMKLSILDTASYYDTYLLWCRSLKFKLWIAWWNWENKRKLIISTPPWITVDIASGLLHPYREDGKQLLDKCTVVLVIKRQHFQTFYFRCRLIFQKRRFNDVVVVILTFEEKQVWL